MAVIDQILDRRADDQCLEQGAAQFVVMLAHASGERRCGQADDPDIVVLRQQCHVLRAAGCTMALIDDHQANIVRQAANMHRVDAGDQHAFVDTGGVLGLQDAVGNAVVVQDGAGLIDQLLAVREENDLAAFVDRLWMMLGRRESFTGTSRHVEHHALRAPGQGDAGLLHSVQLVRAEIKSHFRPLLSEKLMLGLPPCVHSE